MYSCGLAAVNQRQSTAIDAIRPAMVFCYPILLYCHTKHLISCYLIFIYITAYRTKCYKSFVFDVLLGAYQIIQHKHTSINKVQGGIQGRSQSIEQLFRGMSTDTKIPSEINRTKNARTAHSATTFTTKYQHLLVAKKKIKSPLKVCISSWQVHVPKSSWQSACLTMFMQAPGWECNQWQLQMSSAQSCTSL